MNDCFRSLAPVYAFWILLMPRRLLMVYDFQNDDEHLWHGVLASCRLPQSWIFIGCKFCVNQQNPCYLAELFSAWEFYLYECECVFRCEKRLLVGFWPRWTWRTQTATFVKRYLQLKQFSFIFIWRTRVLLRFFNYFAKPRLINIVNNSSDSRGMTRIRTFVYLNIQAFTVTTITCLHFTVAIPSRAFRF